MNKKLPEKLAREWEKTILGITVSLLLIAVIIMAVNHYADSDGTIVQANVMPTRPDFVDFTNRNFMTVALPGESVNPLTFSKKMAPTAKLPDPPKIKPTPPNNTQKNDPPPPKESPTPKKNARVISVRYEGLYKGLLNNELAFVSATDSASRTTSQEPRASGEKLFAVITIDSFNAEELHISNGDKALTVPLGKEIKVKIPE